MKNKKIIFAGLVVSAFMVVVLSANSANASFWNWFKAGDDNTAAVTRPSSSKSSSSRSSKSSSSKLSSSKSSRSSATTTKSYTLKINKSGKGYVSDEDKRIDCGTNCKEEYVAGSKSGDRVKLTAVPDGGYVFEKFTPAKECSSVYSGGFGLNDNKLIKQALAYGPGENVVCVTTMNKNKTITAVFKKIPGASSSSKSKSSSSKSSAPRRSSSTNSPLPI